MLSIMAYSLVQISHLSLCSTEKFDIRYGMMAFVELVSRSLKHKQLLRRFSRQLTIHLMAMPSQALFGLLLGLPETKTELLVSWMFRLMLRHIVTRLQTRILR